MTRAVRRRPRWPFVAGAVGLVLAAAAAVLLVRTLQYRGETMPGVRVLGTDVSGRHGAALERRIEAIAGARLAKPVTVAVGVRKLSVKPEDLLAVDVHRTADAALDAGRTSFLTRAGTLLSPIPSHREVEPLLRIRRVAAGAFLVRLRRLGREPIDASVRVEGLRPVVVPARIGSVPNGNEFLIRLERAVLDGRRAVRVSFRPDAPAIPTVAARVAAAEASVFLSAPVELRFQGSAVGRLDPPQLAQLLRFIPDGDRYVVSFAHAALAQAVEPALARYETKPVDASFVVQGSGVAVVPSRPGAKLDPGEAVAAVAAAARATSGRIAPLSLRETQPKLTTAGARALGIRTQLVSFTTQMGTSSSNRIHNVHLMADFIDDTIIRPGETFSFNEVVGPRTTARGFLEGQQIVGSLTLPAIGGGVCQTATTLFNDAFEAGLPILERHNHGYYLSHYPLGRDATVSYGGPDLVFENDLDHGILIKTSYTDATLTFTFYGTPQRRRVVSSTGPQTNWTSPKTTYAYDPSGQVAPAGRSVTVAGSGERGFDVTVYRKVYENKKLLRDNTFFSRYIPVGSTVVYGPGTHPPRPYIVLPSGP
jgi:vancomycin resistance protein YoaR